MEAVRTNNLRYQASRRSGFLGWFCTIQILYVAGQDPGDLGNTAREQTRTRTDPQDPAVPSDQQW